MSGSRVLAPGVPGAPTLVFVHGLEDSWASWHPLAAALDPDWRLVALDMPWRAGNDYRWRSRPAAGWLGEALDRLGVVPDAVVAHSFGASATLDMLCAADPRLGRAAMLVCPLYRHPDRPVTWGMFDGARREFVTNIREGLRARLGPRAGSMDAAVLETMMDLAVQRVGPAGFLTVFDQFTASADLPLHRVDLPTRVVAAGTDPTLSRAAAGVLAATIPGVSVRYHDDYDHFCHIRHARGVASQVADLVAAARPASRTTGEPPCP